VEKAKIVSVQASGPFRKRVLLALGLAVFLSACGGGRMGSQSTSSSGQMVKTRTIQIADQQIVVEGPKGFCIDEKTTEERADLAFVLLASCQATSSAWNAPKPAVKALLTTSIMQGGEKVGPISAAGDDLDRFFRSETGKTALSRSSDPGSVEILETRQDGDTFYIRASDSSLGVVPGASRDYWRAYLDIKGQLVSLSVIGMNADPLPPEKGLQLLKEFVAIMREKNGVVTAQPVTQVAQVVAEPANQTTTDNQTNTNDNTARPAPPPTGNGFWRMGLLRKIFN